MTNIFDKMTSADASHDRSSEAEFCSNGVPEQEACAHAGPERTSLEIKAAVQELLKQGSLEEANRQDLFRRVVVDLQAINAALEPLDLIVRIDTYRGVAFLAVAPSSSDIQLDEEGWTHPLVRKQRLTLEQSMLVAILRQAFVMHEQECGVGQVPAKVAVDELLPTFLTYFGDTGSDAKNESRLLQLLDQLKAHGIVSEVDKKQEVTIRPLIAHLANPESLAALLNVLKEKRQMPADVEDGE